MTPGSRFGFRMIMYKFVEGIRDTRLALEAREELRHEDISFESAFRRIEAIKDNIDVEQRIKEELDRRTSPQLAGQLTKSAQGQNPRNLQDTSWYDAFDMTSQPILDGLERFTPYDDNNELSIAPGSSLLSAGHRRNSRKSFANSSFPFKLRQCLYCFYISICYHGTWSLWALVAVIRMHRQYYVWTCPPSAAIFAVQTPQAHVAFFRSLA
ncbi:hypothetical protein BDY21DRAFT_31523 [Lineolata rhizophorae]|uniref:Uncharacterized protein n=1 Tax=Lineolata rhizophorae TaxID=578093 RepID=A0A6A6P114_9PEZI|nr:hypothetical protein BDY21DRAFT_31523 [Lineolata rhizophorae]